MFVARIRLPRVPPTTPAPRQPQQKNRASPSSPLLRRHTHNISLSLPSSHHRACGARAAVAHRDVADATDTAIATVTVHHLRGTDGRPLSPTRSKTADDRPPPPAHRLPPQRDERATRAGKGAHRVVAVRRMTLHRLRHSSGARQGQRHLAPSHAAPHWPTDSTTPDAPLLRVARDPRDAREVSGRTGSMFPSLIGSQRLVVQLRFHPATAWREAE